MAIVPFRGDRYPKGRDLRKQGSVSAPLAACEYGPTRPDPSTPLHSAQDDTSIWPGNAQRNLLFTVLVCCN